MTVPSVEGISDFFFQSPITEKFWVESGVGTLPYEESLQSCVPERSSTFDHREEIVENMFFFLCQHIHHYKIGVRQNG